MDYLAQLNCPPDLLRQQLRPLAIRVRQHHDELLPAITRQQIGGTMHNAPQHLSDLFQAVVPAHVTISVVVKLEMVNIHHQQ